MSEAVPQLLLLLTLAATLFMTGVIWFVQVVHYPLFANVGGDFRTYEQRHTDRTGWIVAPAMLLEGAASVAQFWFPPAGVSTLLLTPGILLLVVIWISTAFVQIPCHTVLAEGFDPRVHQRLVRTNWVRTAAWSLRSAILLAICLNEWVHRTG